jgi:hypothetical protein
LFLIALPMGFVDFIVPFVVPGRLVLIEIVLFALAALSVAVAWIATRRVEKTFAEQNKRENPQSWRLLYCEKLIPKSMQLAVEALGYVV